MDKPNLFQFVPPKVVPAVIEQTPTITRPEWHPSIQDKRLIDEWFDDLAQFSGSVDQLGGKEVATFLKQSNLPKDTLRTIWSLVDSSNKGRIDRDQFMKIIRLVSIHCSPIFAGSQPTLERYYDTVDDENITLPLALRTAAENKKQVNNEEMLISTLHVPAFPTNAALESLPSPEKLLDNDEEFSEFTAASASEVAVATSLPSPMPVSHDFLALDVEPLAVVAALPIDYQNPFASSSGYGPDPQIVHTPAHQEDDAFDEFVSHQGPSQSHELLSHAMNDSGAYDADFITASSPFNPPGAIDFSPAAVLPPLLPESIAELLEPNEEEEFDTFVSHSIPEMKESEVTVDVAHLPPPRPPLPRDLTMPDAMTVPVLSMVTAPMTNAVDKMSAFDDIEVEDSEDWNDFSDVPPQASLEPTVDQLVLEEEEEMPKSQELPVTVSLLDFDSEIVHSSVVVPQSTVIVDLLDMDWTPAGPSMDQGATELLRSASSLSDFETDFGGFVDANAPSPLAKQSSEPFVMISHNESPRRSDSEEAGSFQGPPRDHAAIADEGDDFGDFETHQEEPPSESNAHHILAVVAPPPLPPPPPLPSLPTPLPSPQVQVAEAKPSPVAVPEPKMHVVDTSPLSPTTQMKLGGRFFTHNQCTSDEKDTTNNSAPLSLPELEELSEKLARKHLYEEAYDCARQVQLLQRISALLEQKRIALDNDKREVALTIKNETSVLAKQLEPQSQEAVWISAAMSPSRQVYPCRLTTF